MLVQHKLPGSDVLRSALDQMRTIRGGKEDQAILTFNATHRELKEAIRRGAELNKELNGPRLLDLERARKAVEITWPFLREEPDLPDAIADHAQKLADLLLKETLFRELPAIDQHARVLVEEYGRRHTDAVKARAAAYRDALSKLRGTPGWDQLNDEQHQRVVAPLASRATENGCDAISIPMLRADLHACVGLLDRAIEEMLRLIDGGRVVRVAASGYFSGGIETEEQLDAALTGLREQCVELIGAGKKVLVQ